MRTTSSRSWRPCKSCAVPSGPARSRGLAREYLGQAPMEIRVLRGAEVRQLLPMAECIESDAADHDRRLGRTGGIAAALDLANARRSRHDGHDARVSRRPGVFRRQAREPDSAQPAAAIFLASRLGAAVRGRSRPAGRAARCRGDHRDSHRRRERACHPVCWRGEDAGDLGAAWAPASRRAAISRRC